MRKIRRISDFYQSIRKGKPPEESGGFIIETKTNDCPSCDGRKLI
jgi:hypothetical protein